MKSLGDILADQHISCTKKDIDALSVREIVIDSRKVSANSVFVAIKGLGLDGHDFIEQAIENGCAAVVVDQVWLAENKMETDVPVIGVPDSRVALGGMASRFYESPANEMTLIGITGTNGKTTTTYILENIILQAGGNPGVIGTINYRFDGKELPAPHTTPEPVSLQKTLRAMADSGVTHVVMEVSSHALSQRRLEGVLFDIAVFTNLTRDHLDYHTDMESYFAAKMRLFTESLKDSGHAVVLQDEAADGKNGIWSQRLIDELRRVNLKINSSKTLHVMTCGTSKRADMWAEVRRSDVNGLCGTVYAQGKQVEFDSHLVGEFNVQNILGAVGASLCLGVNEEDIGKGISGVASVPGRMEKVRVAAGHDCVERVAVFVDYAHSPDALENVLSTLHGLKHKRIIVVFGCGGDRDQGKRFLMGEIAGRLADLAVVTADNSRSEEPTDIMAEICRGLEAGGKTKSRIVGGRIEQQGGYVAVVDRSEAINVALNSAAENDIVLVSGKGHENYQITNTGSIFFDDRQEVRRCLENMRLENLPR